MVNTQMAVRNAGLGDILAIIRLYDMFCRYPVWRKSSTFLLSSRR
jgi:hypothetical protein